MTEIPKFSDFNKDAPAPAPSPAETANPAEAEAADVDPSDIPALFATIHHKSEQRPDGYSEDDIAELNHAANAPRAAPDAESEKDKG